MNHSSNHAVVLCFRGSHHCASVFWLGSGDREWQHQGMERDFFPALAGSSFPGDTHKTLFMSRLRRLFWTRTRALIIALSRSLPLYRTLNNISVHVYPNFPQVYMLYPVLQSLAGKVVVVVVVVVVFWRGVGGGALSLHVAPVLLLLYGLPCCRQTFLTLVWQNIPVWFPPNPCNIVVKYRVA